MAANIAKTCHEISYQIETKSKQQGTDALMGFLCNSGGFRSHIEIKARKEAIDGYYDRALIYAAQLGHDRVTRLMSIASTYDYRR